MQIIKTKAELAALSSSWQKEGQTIGFVPTMGALHAGHLSLINALDGKASRRIVSIFVNPIQFNNTSDFQHYPRGLEDDASLLRKTGKVDVLYAPDESQMYPPGFATRISVSGLDNMLCGGDRPGHFDGVATVVTKLFLQTRANIAAFGEKDYQQLCLIKRMVLDLDLPVDILPVPTLRETDGLALSSRNRRLTPEQRQQAALLPQALAACLAAMKNGTSVESSLDTCRETLKKAGFYVHYLELRHAENLAPAPIAGKDTRLFVAASLGSIRLIDNMPFA